MIVIGTGAGSKAEIDFGRLMQRRARIQSSTLRSRTTEEKAQVVDGLRRDVLPLLASERITVPVHETFPLADAQKAYEAFAAGGKFGKLVLII
jgi:NADPH:quinone reductase